MDGNMETIRYGEGGIYLVDDGDGNLRLPTQEEMDSLPVGEDLTDEEIEGLDE